MAKTTHNRNVDEQYREVLSDVLETGTVKSDRTGTGTMSVFGRMLRFDMALGFPLVTLKKTNFRPILHELLWMLDSVDQSYRERGFGPDNIKYLCDNKVSIWDEWPYKHYAENCTDLDYLARSFNAYADGSFIDEYRNMDIKEFAEKIRTDDEFAREWGKLGNVYGQQWNHWEGGVNQIRDAVEALKKNPDSRRIMVTAWNPTDVPDALLPPCHYAFQYWTRPMDVRERMDAAGLTDLEVKGDFATDQVYEAIVAIHEALDRAGAPSRKLSLMFQMRSVDLGCGISFDIASYATQLMMMAQVVGMVPDELVVCTGDTHIYSNHIEQMKRVVKLPAFPLPTLTLNSKVKHISDFRYEDFTLNDYQSGPFIKLPIAV